VLEKLRCELNTSLEKLTTRWKFLNEQFDRLMQQYRAQRQQLQDIQVRACVRRPVGPDRLAQAQQAVAF
jgi:chaperonin cofactor prefoldin